jgi:hypothetical protein
MSLPNPARPAGHQPSTTVTTPVKTHLVHIFAKLGVDSRSELAAEAARHELKAQPGPRE